jgi:hypothetical protein
MAKREALTEDEALEVALNDHPQWIQQWKTNTLPKEIIGEDGEPMNPTLHIILHTIIERQLSADDPAGVADVARTLEQLGVSRHEVRHQIGGPLSQQLWAMQYERQAFDVSQYMDDLHQIVESRRRDDSVGEQPSQ